MPITREDGFLRWPDAPGFPAIGIESGRLAECIAEVQHSGVKQVFGAPDHGFAETDLDFLAQLPFLEAVWFWDVALDQVDALYELRKLRSFGIHPGRPPIEFDRFPGLERAVLELRPKDTGLERLQSLQTLHLWRYREKNFASLRIPESLTELKVNWASVSSLEDLPCLPKLRRMEVHHCRNLSSLGPLKERFPELEHLVITACGRVSVDEGARAIEGLPKLKHALVETTVLVSQ